MEAPAGGAESRIYGRRSGSALWLALSAWVGVAYLRPPNWRTGGLGHPGHQPAG